MDLTEPQITQKSQECFDFWFDDPSITGPHNSHGFQSKIYNMFSHVVPCISIPEEGFIVQLGTNYGISFDVLYRQFPEQSLGIDLWNPLNHPNIIEKNMYELEDMPLAFCNVDVGDFRWTPKLRMYAINYAIRNIVKEGIIITAGGWYADECLGLNLAEHFKDNKFKIYNYKDFYHNLEFPEDLYIHNELIAISS